MKLSALAAERKLTENQDEAVKLILGDCTDSTHPPLLGALQIWRST
jgi:hypothetical protein